MTHVRLREIGKKFGDFTALEDLDLEIQSGELVALLGPSGCGKTTTLRTIAGLEALDRGEVLFNGNDVSDLAVQKRNVGLVFQRYALFPHMSVEQNITFGLDVRKLPKSEISARLEQMLEAVQLTPFAKRFPAQLSGGQMQRVAIARTLITNPSVLMLDEPFANLDANLRLEMRQFIRDLQKRLGITTIFVTHDQEEAMELADRVAIMFDGKLAQFSAPEDLYLKPQTIAVAHFMGAKNIFRATLDSPSSVITDFARLDIASNHPFATGDDVFVMLRSEGIDMLGTTDTRQDAQNVISGRIKSREFSGASVQYSVEIGSVEIFVTEHSRRLLDVGETVKLSISPQRVWMIAT